MAAGVPATGIGGIFYIILTVGILIARFVRKICVTIKRKMAFHEKIARAIRRGLPGLTLISCIVLLSYMNLTGFRFILFIESSYSIPTNNFLYVLFSAVLFFIILLLLIGVRARKIRS